MGTKRVNGTDYNVNCNIDVVTGTPSPVRGIIYGMSMTCSDPGISGSGVSHLGEYTTGGVRALQQGNFFNISGNGQPHWAIQGFRRESDQQLEQIYSFFSVTIDEPGSRWNTHPTAGGAEASINCTPTGSRTLTCALITVPFAYLPDSAACDSGDVCELPKYATEEPTATPGLPSGVSALQPDDLTDFGLGLDNEAPAGGYYADAALVPAVESGRLTAQQAAAMTPAQVSQFLDATGQPRRAGVPVAGGFCGASMKTGVRKFGFFLYTDWSFKVGCRGADIVKEASSSLLRATTGSPLAAGSVEGPSTREYLPSDGEYEVMDSPSQRRLGVKVYGVGYLRLPANGRWMSGFGGCLVQNGRRQMNCNIFSKTFKQAP